MLCLIHMSSNRVLFDNDIPDNVGFSSGFCTFVSTGKRQSPQYFRHCVACAVSCCLSCFQSCHAGHELSEERFGSMYCECGSRGGGGGCKCLPDKGAAAGASPRKAACRD